MGMKARCPKVSLSSIVLRTSPSNKGRSLVRAGGALTCRFGSAGKPPGRAVRTTCPTSRPLGTIHTLHRKGAPFFAQKGGGRAMVPTTLLATAMQPHHARIPGSEAGQAVSTTFCRRRRHPRPAVLRLVASPAEHRQKSPFSAGFLKMVPHSSRSEGWGTCAGALDFACKADAIPLCSVAFSLTPARLRLC